MAEWISYFKNVPDFGMQYLLIVPDQCIAFFILMLCLMAVLSIREREPGSEEAWERKD